MKRIKDKINEIEEFLDQLKSIIPENLDEYQADITKKAACERYVEKIIEAVTDLSFLIIKKKDLKIPQDDIDAFNILLNNKIIDNDLAKRLKEAKGMRNIIVHQYGEIDDKIVFNSVTNELEKDVKVFISQIKKIEKL